jgi:hypothetical protein
VYFIKDKKYTRNPKGSSSCPEATVDLRQRKVSCPQDRLRIGGLKTGDSPPPPTLYNSCRQLRLQLQSTTPLYYSALQSFYRLPWKTRLPSQLLLSLLLLPSLPRSSSPSEPRTSRSIVSRIVNTVQEHQPPSAPSPSYYSQ